MKKIISALLCITILFGCSSNAQTKTSEQLETEDDVIKMLTSHTWHEFVEVEEEIEAESEFGKYTIQPGVIRDLYTKYETIDTKSKQYVLLQDIVHQYYDNNHWLALSIKNEKSGNEWHNALYDGISSGDSTTFTHWFIDDIDLEKKTILMRVVTGYGTTDDQVRTKFSENINKYDLGSYIVIDYSTYGDGYLVLIVDPETQYYVGKMTPED